MCKNRVFLGVVGAALLALVAIAAGCTASASKSEFFGKIDPLPGQTLRYISGSEPESLDPQMSTGQPEARIHMALYDGLVEYHPQTMQPIPAIAESWILDEDATEVVFKLRQNARFSNGDPIKAQDFVYTFQRGLSPELASRSAALGYDVKYAKAYNEGGAFVYDPAKKRFLTATETPKEAKKEGEEEEHAAAEEPEESPTITDPEELHRQELAKKGETAAKDTEFHKFIHEPTRLVVPFDAKQREKELKDKPNLKALIEGKEFHQVRGDQIGIEAVDDYTVRITLSAPTPYFVGLLGHQFFRVIHKPTVERYGATWAKPGTIVTSGAFKLQEHKPYDKVVLVKDPMNWDAGRVRLDKIIFYPLEAVTTMMNLYKAGEVDATYNHTVPAAWLKSGVGKSRDYMNAPENAVEYYAINCTKPPMNDKRVRHAFSLAIDRQALADFRVAAKPLSGFIPKGIYPGYPEMATEAFNPERAKQLLAEAGYADASGKYDPSKFPVDAIAILYNTSENAQQNAEFIQAQWKQNLGLTVQLNNMEWKTYLDAKSKLQYTGFARAGWVGDYMDPFTFLNLFTTLGHDNSTGWLDQKYVDLLKEANREPDVQKRYQLLAKAEAYLLEERPVIPLYIPATSWMKKPYVKGLYPNPGTLHAWKYVYIEHDRAKWDYEMPDLTRDILAE